MSADLQVEPPTDSHPPETGYVAAASKESKAVRGLVVTIVLALLAAGFALITMSGGGGADTPSAAVEQLAAAVGSEDTLAALQVLAPAERDALGASLNSLVTELRRLGVITDGASMRSVSGLDLDVKGLRLEELPVTDGITSVRIAAGSLVSKINGEQLPVGPVLRTLLDNSATGMTEEAGTDGSFVLRGGSTEASPFEFPKGGTAPLGPDLILTTVERGGRWYVSIGYSIAEAARRDANAPIPRLADRVGAKGSDSPEAAVRALLDAGAALDPRRAIEVVAPDEAAALHDYAPLFLPQSEVAIALARSKGLSASIQQLELSTQRRGDAAIVTVERLQAKGSYDGKGGTVDYDGKCVVMKSDSDEPISSCDPDSLIPGPRGGPPNVTFSAVQEGGLWYVSPLRTWLDGMVTSLRKVDRADLDGPDAGEAGLGLLMGGSWAMSPFSSLFLFGAMSSSSRQESVEFGSGPGEFSPSPEGMVCTETRSAQGFTRSCSSSAGSLGVVTARPDTAETTTTTTP